MRTPSSPHLLLIILWFGGAVWAATLIGDTPISGRDFSSLWVAGHAARAGIDVYDLDQLRALGNQLLNVDTLFNYTYPPHGLFLAVPLSLLPLTLSFALWNVASLALFYLAARPYAPRGFPAILAILTPAALLNLIYGQYGLLAGTLWLFAFRGSGLAAAALTIKPHIGFLVAFRMLPERRWLVVAVIATLALVALSQLVFGGWPEFLAHASGFQATNLVRNPEIPWYFAATTPMIGYGIWGWFPFALAGALLLARNFNVFTAATATFLITPYGFHYDMAVVCLGFGLLLWTAWEHLPAWQRLVCVAAFFSPLLATLGTWLVPPILLAGLWVQVANAYDRRERRFGRLLRDEARPLPLEHT